MNINGNTKRINAVSQTLKTELLLFAILILLFVVFGMTSEVFLNFNNIMLLLRQASIYGIIAIGMVFVIISSGIDISVGSTVALSGVITAMCLNAGMEILQTLVLAIIGSLVVGMVNGLLIYNGKVPAFIATMGTMTVVRAFIMLITNAKTISGLPQEFKDIAQKTILGVPLMFVVWLLVAILGFIVLNKTVFGRNIFAYGSNKETARLSGINIHKTIYGVYMFSATCCGIAGFLLTARLGNASPNVADGYELDAIAAAVVGGASLDGGEGSIVGTVLGAMIMATLRQGGTLLGINPFMLEIIIGSLIVIAVLLDKSRKK